MPDDARFDWLADAMAVRPEDQVLELGPGAGVSLARIAGRLRGGRIVGVDKSATAVRRARERCAVEVADGRVRVVEGAIGPASVGAVLAEIDSGRFDLVFGVNVNLFWTGPGVDAWAMVRACLSPGGQFWLCYGYGGPDAASTSPKPAAAVLESRAAAAGFSGRVLTAGDLLAVGLTAEG
ncbi:class I SAM-dependent methyltransferase [Nocardia asteroides]|uniref:SAM-dependent methyltransferase n=1 Tax=Nocardia asteroides TaxID=1824 RepID=UPI00343A96A0